MHNIRVSKPADDRVRPEPLAIIGIGCRFPGGASTPERFWRLLAGGVDAITEIPERRWSVEQFYHPDPRVIGTTYSKWGGFIADIDQFDPGTFGISPREAQSMDPQQRLMLEVTKEAMEDAGQVSATLRGSDTGVFVGISTWDYSLVQYGSQTDHRADPYTATGTALSIVANRISYCFDFRGPSLVVDTACSSSLVAVHLACESILRGDCRMAVGGGVNLFLSPANAIAFSKMGVLSPDGRCKAFDASANGFVRAEGAGVVVIKPLSRAVEDGDRVYALIEATGMNQDGITNGLAVPSARAQSTLIRETFRKSGLDPSQVAYVEAHGTGTAVGDPIEADAIGRTIGAGRSRDRCPIGSVKTNIGHLESAAGIAGLIKAALVLHEGTIPPSLHLETPNPQIDFDSLGLEVVTATRLLPEHNGSPRLAVVNSFGFGGTNALAILSEPAGAHTGPHRNGSANGRAGTPHEAAGLRLIPLSAISHDRLSTLASSWVDFLAGSNRLDEIGSTAALRRDHHAHRLCVVASDGAEAAQRIEAFLNDERSPGVVSGEARVAGSRPRVVFVFSGQGPQWWAMGRQLVQGNPVYRRTIEECDRIVERSAGWSLIDALAASEADSRIREAAIAQPALCALQIALAEVWKSFGIIPDATLGHSVGELAAAHVSGHLGLEEAMRVVLHRGRSIQQFARRGRMLAAAVGHDEARELLEQSPGSSLAIAASNSPGNVTFAGEESELAGLARRLEYERIHHQFLHVDFAFHSELMEPARVPFLSALGELRSGGGRIDWVSTVTGRVVDHAVDGDYWWQNVRSPVLFRQALDSLLEAGYDTVVELSPHPVMLPSVTECFKARQLEPRVAVSLRRDEDDDLTMLSNLGLLHCWGCPVDWTSLYPEMRRPVTLPTYPWRHESFWCDNGEGRQFWRAGRPHPLLGTKTSTHQPTWRTVLDPHRVPFLNQHRFQDRALLPATAYVDMAFFAAHEVLGAERPVLEALEFRKALFLPPEPDTALLLTEYNEADREVRFFSRPSHADAGWTLHCRVRLGGDDPGTAHPRLDPAEVIARCPDSYPGDILYQFTEGSQLEYRGPFRGLKQFWRSPTEVIARVELADDLEPSGGGHFFHPAFLDSCIQACGLNRPFGLASTTLQQITFVPVRVAEIRLHRKPATRTVWTHVVKTRDTLKGYTGDMWIYDEDGTLLVSARQFESQGVERRATGDGSSIDDWAVEMRYVPRPYRSPPQPIAPRAARPSLSEIAAGARAVVARIVTGFGQVDRLNSLVDRLDRLALEGLARAFRRLGLEEQAGRSLTFEDIIAVCGIAPAQVQYTRFALAHLAAAGLLDRTDTGWSLPAAAPIPDDPAAGWRETLHEFPVAYAELMMLANVGARLPDVLTGKTTFQELVFHGGARGLIEHFYQDSLGLIPFNVAAAHAVARLAAAAPTGRTMRILEIGAGTGGVTSHLLPRLEGSAVEYLFTDVSPALLGAARRGFPEYPFVEYRILDLEIDPVEQGFDAHGYDVIIAANVLHAVPDVTRSLGHVRRLLAPGGVFCLLEVIQTPKYVHSIFGLTREWWLIQGERMELPSRRDWQATVEREFAVVEDIAEGMATTGSPFGDGVALLARVEPREAVELAHGRAAVEEDPASGRPDRGQNWLILADRQRLGEELAGRLVDRGGSCTVLAADDGVQPIADAIESAAESASPYDSVVHLWSLDCTPDESLSLEALHADRVLTCESVVTVFQAVAALDRAIRPRVYAVTQGLEPVGGAIGPRGLSQSSLRGVLLSGACEFPRLRVRLIDLDPERAPECQVETLLHELLSDPDEPEREVAFRGDVRFGARLRPTTLTEIPDGECVPLRRPRTVDGDPPARFALGVPRIGTIDRLRYREVRPEPLRGDQLEVRVVAAGLNFRDVLKVLGLYPLDGDYLSLGDECAGVVERVGGDVTEFRPGDEVICIGGPCFASHVVAHEHMTMPRPEQLGFEEAATLPIAFLTAQYALFEVARLEPGERVLIHAAAGGVGLAAVQLAQKAGAEVFATASESKQEFLRLLGVNHVMDSRSHDFADEIHKRTGGRGVDVILNSLSGEAIPKSLSVLARYGRFIEIGKRDLYDNRKIGLGHFREGISFHSIDLGRLAVDRPEVIRRMRPGLLADFRSGKLRPLPHRMFPAYRVRDAFRTMAEARHIGKLVVSFREPELRLEPAPPEPTRFTADATYLITGGSSGFGLEIAHTLLANGVRHVVLLGRSDPSSDRVRKAVARLEGFPGAHVAVVQADVADSDAMAAAFARITRDFPPLRGIVHAAGVVEDGPIVQMDAPSFHRVMAPKVDGLWNLHELTSGLDLDFLVLISSISSLLGNPGQTNYAAANSFLDSFAYYRKARGLPATVINFGPLADVGLVARDHGVADRMARRGATSLPIPRAIEIIRAVLLRNRPWVGALRVQWARWLEAIGFTEVPTTVLDVYENDVTSTASEQSPTELRQALRQARAAERPHLVAGYVSRVVARVLGTPAEQLDAHQPLQSLGLDSLTTVELCNRLENDLAITLPPAELARQPSLNQLSTVILDLLPQTAPGPVEVAS